MTLITALLIAALLFLVSYFVTGRRHLLDDDVTAHIFGVYYSRSRSIVVKAWQSWLVKLHAPKASCSIFYIVFSSQNCNLSSPFSSHVYRKAKLSSKLTEKRPLPGLPMTHGVLHPRIQYPHHPQLANRIQKF